ncbi:MAG: PHB depolymerase family esterase [Candidatus Marinimicrobia bacterium]|nr:PHB depolymerase family esterase [Candidatus Neomarinimicrobiota bacterium]
MLKRLFTILSLCLAGLVFGQDLEYVKDFGKNPGHLRMYQYIPENLDTETPCPLLLVLHGSGQTAYALSLASGFNKLADSLGFIIAYPDQPFYNNLLTSFSFYMPGKMKKDQGETASVRNMIFYMKENHNIDPKRIFITGMSAGGAMANVMLNAYPGLFAAGALFAAPSVLHEDINPDRTYSPRIAIIQGKYDLTVLPKNADRLMNQWREFHQLDSADFRYTERYLGHSLLSLIEYPAQGKTKLARLDLDRTGHLLLVDPGKAMKQGGQYSLFTKDVNFHLPYWIVEFFGLAR